MTWRDDILAALRDDDHRQAAERALLDLPLRERAQRIDATLAGALVLLLGDPSRSRQRAVSELLQKLVADAPAVEDALRAALDALDPRLRWGAAYTLGHAHSPPMARLWPAVREALGREDGDQRWAAAELACELARHHAAVRDEMIAATAQGSPTARRMLLYCLRDLDDPALGEIAAARLGDDDTGVRLAALSAAVRARQGADETERLAGSMAGMVETDPDPGVRRAAAAALGKLGATGARVLETLQRAAGGDDPGLARAAKKAREHVAARRREN